VLNVESPGSFLSRLSEKRWALARAMQGQGELAVRELARRVGRDVKRVHEDVQTPIELGLVERVASGAVVCPFDEVHIDRRLQAPRGRAARTCRAVDGDCDRRGPSVWESKKIWDGEREAAAAPARPHRHIDAPTALAGFATTTPHHDHPALPPQQRQHGAAHAAARARLAL